MYNQTIKDFERYVLFIVRWVMELQAETKLTPSCPPPPEDDAPSQADPTPQVDPPSWS